MNKAFTREPESTADYCPRCGAKGERVAAVTVAAHLAENTSVALAEPASFCPSPGCAVVYFDSFERVALASDLARPVYPKDPSAPVCACFGLTVDDIAADVREGVTTRVKAAITRARSAEARCSEAAADGRPCIAHIQRCYMQMLGRQQG